MPRHGHRHRWRSIPSAIAPRCTCGWPTRRGRSARARRARATCASTPSSTPRSKAGADAVHPGYGFLAENEDFAAACRDAGLTFIGPSPEAIALMGSKTAARQAAIKPPACRWCRAPKSRSAIRRPTPRSLQVAERIGYPLMLKAVAGGGGKGMRMVASRRGSARRAARRALRSAVGVRRRRGVSRAPHHVAAAHRSAGARRSARHGAAVRRARVLDPAASPEGRRGEPVAGGLAGAARAA